MGFVTPKVHPNPAQQRLQIPLAQKEGSRHRQALCLCLWWASSRGHVPTRIQGKEGESLGSSQPDAACFASTRHQRQKEPLFAPPTRSVLSGQVPTCLRKICYIRIRVDGLTNLWSSNLSMENDILCQVHLEFGHPFGYGSTSFTQKFRLDGLILVMTKNPQPFVSSYIYICIQKHPFNSWLFRE